MRWKDYFEIKEKRKKVFLTIFIVLVIAHLYFHGQTFFGDVEKKCAYVFGCNENSSNSTNESINESVLDEQNPDNYVAGSPYNSSLESTYTYAVSSSSFESATNTVFLSVSSAADYAENAESSSSNALITKVANYVVRYTWFYCGDCQSHISLGKLWYYKTVYTPLVLVVYLFISFAFAVIYSIRKMHKAEQTKVVLEEGGEKKE